MTDNRRTNNLIVNREYERVGQTFFSGKNAISVEDVEIGKSVLPY